jgi:hypothetical protein
LIDFEASLLFARKKEFSRLSYDERIFVVHRGLVLVVRVRRTKTLGR